MNDTSLKFVQIATVRELKNAEERNEELNCFFYQ